MKILLIFLSANLIAAKTTLPVLMLDYERIMNHVVNEPNPFTKISSSHFYDIVQEAVDTSKVVILFIEDSLCVEDLSAKDKSGSPFYHLQQGIMNKRVKYMPSVADPFRILQQVFEEDQSYKYRLDSSSKFELYNPNAKHYYIYFKDGANETRVEALRRHDIRMSEVYGVIRDIAKGPLIAFYTGKNNPVVVGKMNFVALKPNVIPRTMGVTVESEGALFRLTGVYATMGKRRAMFSQIPVIPDETWTPHRLATRISYTDFELQFNFGFKREGWTIDTVALLEGGEEVGRTLISASAPWNWSYVCNEPLMIGNTRDGSAVTISQYQIQPFPEGDGFWNTQSFYDDKESDSPSDSPGWGSDPSFKGRPGRSGTPFTGEGSKEKKKFGRAVNCGPYFNAHILACLFVSFLLLGILFYGVVFLCNCQSCDRYDDAQGKPLVIASDGSQ